MTKITAAQNNQMAAIESAARAAKSYDPMFCGYDLEMVSPTGRARYNVHAESAEILIARVEALRVKRPAGPWAVTRVEKCQKYETGF